MCVGGGGVIIKVFVCVRGGGLLLLQISAHFEQCLGSVWLVFLACFNTNLWHAQTINFPYGMFKVKRNPQHMVCEWHHSKHCMK